MQEVNQHRDARLEQTDKNLLLNQDKIKVLTTIQIKQEENILINRKGLKELMGQLDEIESDIDMSIDKQYQLHHQVQAIQSSVPKAPITDFFGQNEALIWSDVTAQLVDDFCVNRGETLEFFARLTLEHSSEDSDDDTLLMLEIEGQGPVSVSKEQASRVGDMTLFYKQTFEEDASVRVMFKPGANNRVIIMPKAFQYGIKVYDHSS